MQSFPSFSTIKQRFLPSEATSGAMRLRQLRYAYVISLTLLIGMSLLNFVLLQQATRKAQGDTQILSQNPHEGEFVYLENLEVITLVLTLGTLLVGSFLVFRPLVAYLELEDKKIRQERSLLRTVIDNIPDYIFAKDRAGRFLISNIAHAKAVRIMNPEDLIGRTAVDYFPSELAAQFDADDQEIMESGKALISLERVTVDADGNRLNVSTTKVPLRDESGTVTGLVGISRDITGRKQVEDALRRSKSLYRLLAKHLPNTAVLLYDHDLRYLVAEGHILAETGYPPDLMEERSLWEILPAERATLLEPFYRSALNGETTEFEWTSGDKVYLITSMPVKGENGEIFAGMFLIRDITEQKLADAHQIDLRFERERVSILNHFIQDASHEFWTPLSIMQTSLHLLERSVKSPRAKERIETLREQANYIEHLVHDLLLMSRMDGNFEYQFSPLSPNTILEELSVKWQPVAQEKEITLKDTLDDNLPMVKIDEGSLTQALDNIIKNAVSFTSAGGTIDLISERDGNNILIRVKDSGIGIKPEVLPHIFERFYRGDQARSDRASGLGLSIAQKIIEVHGGTIQVESLPEVGSTFTICIPIPQET